MRAEGVAMSSFEETLELLKGRYHQLVRELVAIKDDHPLNQPDVKNQDGGTTLEKTKKIKQLEESIAAAKKAIEDHLQLQEVLDAGGEPFTFTFESQLEL